MGYEYDQVLHRAYMTVGGLSPDQTWLHFDEFKVIKVTAKGAWIAYRSEVDNALYCKGEPLEQLSKARPYSWRKWVGESTYFCSPTREEALYHLKRRTACYVKHCERRLTLARRRMRALNEEEVPPDSSFFSDNIALLMRTGEP